MSESMKKFCVFCGSKPESKNCEHIIPTWLIELTGDPRRNAGFGFDTKEFRMNGGVKNRVFSFSKFKFPACEKCNTDFSNLEGKAKLVFEKILTNNYISSVEIDILLDWFDKVRIGLWLGVLLLDREYFPLNPRFYIKDRIAKKDRCLFIYEVDDDWRGIQMLGTFFPVFLLAPCCFTLVVNKFYFFNMSFEFLFSRNIGFPFPEKAKFNENDGTTLFTYKRGLGKIKYPLIKRNFLSPSIEIYQPIFETSFFELGKENNAILITDYLKDNCIDFNAGKGAIFYNEQGTIIKLDRNEEIIFNQIKKLNRPEFAKKIQKQIVDTQIFFLISDHPASNNIYEKSRGYTNKNLNAAVTCQKEYRKLLD
jgi:hypothetical protein